MKLPENYIKNHTEDLEYDAIRYYNSFRNNELNTFECDPKKELLARVIWIDCDYGLVYHPTENKIFGTAVFFVHLNGTHFPFYEFLDPYLFFKLIKTTYSWSDLQKHIYGKKILESFNIIKEEWDNFEIINFKEAFSISNDQLRRLAFDQVEIGDMIESLGYKRVKVEGKRVDRVFWDKNGIETIKQIDVVFELLEVDTSSLRKTNKTNRASNTDFCVKCWCTTTNEAHYLWIERQYAHCPLTAIASTCRVQADLIPYIKNIKRQGDIFLIEYKEGFDKDKINTGPFLNKIPLTKEQYFNLLIAEA